jgi:hypothetical protein
VKLRLFEIIVFSTVAWSFAAWGFLYQVKKDDHGTVYGPKGRNRKLTRVKNEQWRNPASDLLAQPSSSSVSAAGPSPSPVPMMNLPTATESDQNKLPKGVLGLKTDFYATRISALDKGTGGSANLLSQSNFNLGVDYQAKFTDRWNAIIYFNSRKLSIIQPSTVTLLDPNITLYSFGAGARYWNALHTFGLSLFAGSEQIPYLKGVSVSQIILDQPGVPVTGASVIWNMKESKPFTFGGEGTVTAYLPTTTDFYQSGLNLGLKGRLFLRQQVSAKARIEFGLNADYIGESTSIVNQNQTDYGIDFKLSLPLDGSWEP